MTSGPLAPGLTELAVIVFATDHNPSLLNRDFLRIQGIVPESWGLEIEDPVIITPPLSRVQFSTGLSITLDRHRLEIADSGVTDINGEARAVRVASRFVETLPHVRYTAVAMIMVSEMSRDDAVDYVRNRYLKDGPWNRAEAVEGVGFRFSELVDSRSIFVVLDADASDGQPLLTLRAHFHHDWDEQYPSHALAVAALREAGNDFAAFGDLKEELLSATPNNE